IVLIMIFVSSACEHGKAGRDVGACAPNVMRTNANILPCRAVPAVENSSGGTR
ncbi:hypothetical protein TNCV_3954191, partial [Trichonephila clavipes]